VRDNPGDYSKDIISAPLARFNAVTEHANPLEIKVEFCGQSLILSVSRGLLFSAKNPKEVVENLLTQAVTQVTTRVFQKQVESIPDYMIAAHPLFVELSKRLAIAECDVSVLTELLKIKGVAA
jgi:hypothetical protein